MIRGPSVHQALRGASGVVLALVLTACGERHTATQTAARVDGHEITVHQINFALRQQPAGSGKVDAAGRQVLEQLIDEQLFVDQAEKLKLDQQPRTRQALAAARREVLAQAYVENVAQGVAPPTDDELHRFFDAHPELFAQRRLYHLQTYTALVPQAEQGELRVVVDGGRPADVEAWFKAKAIEPRAEQSVRPAEDLPMDSLQGLVGGHGVVVADGPQVSVLLATATDPDPVDFTHARVAISNFIVQDARRRAVLANLAALQSSAQVSYQPPFAGLAASQPALGSTHDLRPVDLAAPGARVTLPAAPPEARVRVRLPDARADAVKLSLPASAPGVTVRLPAPSR